MDLNETLNGPPVGHSTRLNEARILSDIDYFERRLSAIGYSGDCAYEKSLARTYQYLLLQRRKLLDNLRAQQV